jgi:hypothetical protein
VEPKNLTIMLLFLFDLVHCVLSEQPAVLWLLVKLLAPGSKNGI